MNDPIALWQLVVATATIAVPAIAMAGASLFRLSRVERDINAHVVEDKAMMETLQNHGERLVALERDAHAARNREQAMMTQLALVDGKVDNIRDIVIRIDERQSRDDTSPRRKP